MFIFQLFLKFNSFFHGLIVNRISYNSFDLISISGIVVLVVVAFLMPVLAVDDQPLDGVLARLGDDGPAATSATLREFTANEQQQNRERDRG